MKVRNEVKLEFWSRSANEGFARTAAACFAAQLDPTLDEVNDIKTAVSEAVTNCIVHAYGGESVENKIVIECSTEETEKETILHITVTDGGCGIEDVEKAVQPFYTTLANDERSGMGFTIMQTFMDGFSLDSDKGKGTRVTMFRRIGDGFRAAQNAEREKAFSVFSLLNKEDYP